ncbi:type 1 fimbrial protein [Burkholderia stagnalis]|uniref:fimbrial protein n=2 Tax=Burkholderia stagnalis TaxID=1503054 RepID=UPI000759840F|nr:fimbrial protein [Burkholderia stagnalis]KWH29309.1 pilus assembly protein FimA [Burkholderia stagnalis]KWH60265.1 pilus assembly protein FimA [Burkholderia stagnalis]RQQ05926.1 type 1 fimbrial protein [Burkholderia stagnalis]RQQ23102.1 type 1 fimbrial protein [Burkholderia stagnalis]RQQ24470.1 type 1 fimbrial protein [Burkholderia stagnalis]
MQKKISIARIIQGMAAVGILASMSPAMAADGEIAFTGKVLATTCSIGAGGGATGNKNMTVKLPSVSAGALASAGNVAGRTPFSIVLSGCTGDSTKVSTVFEPGDTVDAGSGRLNLVSGGEADTVAKNVQINLLNDKQQPIAAGYPGAQQNSQVVALTDGAATLNYFAEYYATGKSVAGSANTRVQYSLDYQ